MRVLIAPLDIAGQARMTAVELEKRGHTVRFYDGNACYLGYEHEEGQEYALKELPPLLNDDRSPRFDIFDLFFGALKPIEGVKIPVKFIHHFCGTDVRQLDVSLKTNPYTVVKGSEKSSESIREHLKKLADLSEHCTIMDEELRPHVEPFFPHVHIVPRMVNVEYYKELTSEYSFNGNKPVVVHAPTHSKVKGTKFVVRAAEELGDDIEFLLVAGMRHKMAEQIYANCDIIVAQLNLDTYGILAVEGMAMGKIVITYLSDDMRKTYPEDPPIVSATRETLRDVLADVVSWSPEKKTEFGERARKYAKKYHSPDVIAPQIINSYEAVL